MVSSDPADRAACLERLSALIDGELDGSGVAQACAHWRDDAASRESWHAFHLIGDVLRSEDLAGDAARDAAFLQSLRARLASEPVVLAPEPVLASPAAAASVVRVANGGRKAWVAASVAAVGFVAVAGVVVLGGGTGPQAPATLAQGGAGSGAAAATVLATEAQVPVANGQLIRDVRLDRYLAAHKQFAGTSALGVPSGFLRSATADAADR